MVVETFMFLCQTSLSFNFRVGRSSVCIILQETCEVLYEVLANEYVKAPSCAKDWERISREFEMRWNFPHCVGMCVSLFYFTSAFTLKCCINFKGQLMGSTL